MNTVFSRIHTKRKARPITKNIGYLSIKIVEEIVESNIVFVFSVLLIMNSKDGAREQIEPATAQSDIIRCTSFTNRTFELQTAIKQTDAETTMEMVKVAIASAHINHRRQAATIACRETTFIEIDILYHIRVERRKQSERVVYLIKWCTINQKQVLVVTTTMHV